MAPWVRAASLFQRIAAFDATRELGRQQRERESRELADWYVRSEGLLLEALCVELERKVLELGSAGSAIRVMAPSTARVAASDGASLRYLNVCFEHEAVTAYSVRQPAGALMLHWAWQLRTERARYPRILSVPGIRVRRGSQQETVLEAVGVQAAGRVGLSDIAGEILAMLAEAVASRRRLAVGRRSAS